MVRHRISPRQRHCTSPRTSKFEMRSSSPHPWGYYLWQFQGSSSKNLGVVVWQSKKKTNKKNKKKNNPTFWPLVTPDMPLGQNSFLHHCILLFITFDLICNMTMLVNNGFWTLWGHPHPPTYPRGYIKIPNVFLQPSSIELSPVKVSRF